MKVDEQGCVRRALAGAWRVLTAGRIGLALVGLAVAAACARHLPDDVPGGGIALPEELGSRLAVERNDTVARNVILFLGDGMGVSTITAARIFDGQSQGLSGEEHETPLAQFPHVALVKTYNSNQQVPDSAGTATAIHTGRKTRAGHIGVAGAARRRNCREALANRLQSIAEIAERAGKATGLVTTTRVTHATPATLYAHVPERDWESDRYLPEADWNLGCRDIAWQLAHFDAGDGLDIVLGGGRREFFGEASGGTRLAHGENLIADWLAGGEQRRYITERRELASIREGEQVLGLFADSHLEFVAERDEGTTEPTLTEMTISALKYLQRKRSGFYLLVEGGKIDLAHHEGKAGYALLEAQEFFRAIDAALSLVDLDETLVLVTADHSHVFTIAGYPVRGNPILGLVTTNDANGEPNEGPALAGDGLPFTTLGYTNGPGAVSDSGRGVPEVGIGALQQSVYPLRWSKIDGGFSYSETHGGEDVALFALGPRSHLVGGIMEQQMIFYVMAHAFGWTSAKAQATSSIQ